MTQNGNQHEVCKISISKTAIANKCAKILFLIICIMINSQAKSQVIEVWSWGTSYFGELGNGILKSKSLYPIKSSKVSSLNKLISIDNCFAIDNSGYLWEWGANYWGELGSMYPPNPIFYSLTPSRITALNQVFQVSRGGNHVLVLKSDGTVWSFGGNATGQFGDGSITLGSWKYPPVQALGLTNVVQVSASQYSSQNLIGNSYALKSDGTVWAWGLNNLGQLGDGTTINRSIPVKVSNLTGIVQIAASGTHILALKSDGTVWSWGVNSNGQLGDGTGGDYTNNHNSKIPVKVFGLTGVVQIACSANSSYALKGDGSVWGWGYNGNGELGTGGILGTQTDKNKPNQILNLTGIVQISAYGSVMALKFDGTVWSWGLNGSGQLGDGTTIVRTAPIQVAGLTNQTYINAIGNVNFSMKSIGSMSEAVRAFPVVQSYAKPFNIVATIADENNFPLTLKYINFYIDNSYVGRALSDASGTATIPVSASVALLRGNHVIKTEFIGDWRFKQSYANTTLTIQ